MNYEEWARTVSPFRAVSLIVAGWGFLAAGSWRSGFPFVGVTLYTPWRSFRPVYVNRTP